MREAQLVRPVRSDLAMAAASLFHVAVAWLTWLKVGVSSRNSYEVFRSAQRFNLEQLDPLRVAWFLVPVVTLAVVTFLAFGYRRLAAALGLLQSLFVGLIGTVVQILGVNTGLGPSLATAGGLVGASLSLVVLFRRQSQTG